ncbi:MAG: hypothetical protein V2G42_08145 [bacterium JZ-2024 1]
MRGANIAGGSVAPPKNSSLRAFYDRPFLFTAAGTLNFKVFAE